MPKLTQAVIKAQGDKYAKAQTAIGKLEKKRADIIAPITEQYNLDCAKATAALDKRLATLRTKAANLYNEVTGWLKERGKPIALEGAKSIASFFQKPQARVIDPKKFFDSVKEHDEKFWDCVTIEVGKAEKLMGKEALDKISTKPTKDEVSLTLK